MEFINWFLDLKLDSIMGAWFEANKYTLAVIIGLPALVYRWYLTNKAKIRAARKEFEKAE